MPQALNFVGRSAELAALTEELEAARAGAPRVVLVEGPAGIGKTTLVERFLAQADAWVLRAAGDEEEIHVVLGAADQLLRHAGQRVRAGDHVAAGAQLLDALGDHQPAIVLLDDAQWVDTESLRALLFTVRRLVDDAVLVLLVVRDGEAGRLPDGLRKPARHVAVQPLAIGEVRELADGAGVAISPRGARRLHDHSGGSPLHARALLSEVAAGAWEDPEITLPAPRSYAELVLARVRALDPDAVALLEAAAVLGLRSSLARAARVGEIAEPFAALGEPVAAQLVELVDGPDIVFAHPLIRAAIYQGLQPRAARAPARRRGRGGRGRTGRARPPGRGQRRRRRAAGRRPRGVRGALRLRAALGQGGVGARGRRTAEQCAGRPRAAGARGAGGRDVRRRRPARPRTRGDHEGLHLRSAARQRAGLRRPRDEPTQMRPSAACSGPGRPLIPRPTRRWPRGSPSGSPSWASCA